MRTSKYFEFYASPGGDARPICPFSWLWVAGMTMSLQSITVPAPISAASVHVPSYPPQAHATRVALLDELQLSLECLAMYLQEQPGIDLVGRYSDCHSLMHLLREGCAVNVVLINQRLSANDPTGLACLQEVAEVDPQARMLMLVCEEVPLLTVCALRAGAAGVISTASDWPTWLSAIHRVAREGRHLSADDAHWQRSMASLTPAECTVLQGIVEGLPGAALAQQLGISEKTVSSHKRSAYRKTGIRSDFDLYRWSPLVRDLLTDLCPLRPAS